ncbi:MAG: hypothetical protein Q7T81_01045 [Pseudolabrys sp.]|nr:hypothetical protein [Pseudolabrys sp.]
MKYLETIVDDILARQRQSQALSARAVVELDDDLFSAGPPPAPAAAAVDLDPRPWPTLQLPPPPGPSALEKKVVEQERELLTRCSQVADLYNLQERQTAELQVAYAGIERGNAAFAALQETATQHALAAAERKKAVTALHQENALLRSQLKRALEDHADLANKMLTVETMFNDREMVVTMALEESALLKAQLAVATEETARLNEAINQAEQTHQRDQGRSEAIIDELNRKVESLFAEHSVQLKTRDNLARRCEDLTRTNAALEVASSEASARLKAQSEHTTFLETVLRVERETAEIRLKALNDRLEDERIQRAASDRTSSSIRQEMAILLRHIARRRAESEQLDSSASQQNAA